jgi:hypothetical protein
LYALSIQGELDIPDRFVEVKMVENDASSKVHEESPTI